MSQRFCLQHFRTGLFVTPWKLVYPQLIALWPRSKTHLSSFIKRNRRTIVQSALFCVSSDRNEFEYAF